MILVRPFQQQTMPRQKAKAGTVSVYVADDRLKLRWQAINASGEKQRYTLSFGAENNHNRIAAERLAKQIELDIASNNFDTSLKKYRPADDPKTQVLSVSKVFEKFIAAKKTELENSSIDKYHVLKNQIVICLGDISIDLIDEGKANKFIKYCQSKDLTGETINAYLTLLRAVWVWAIKRQYAEINPWQDLRVRTEPKPMARPFSEEEVSRILKAFEGEHYYDFVLFVLSIGCRPGEAIALNWDAISEDCSEVWIGRGWDAKTKQLKATKTRKNRTLLVNESCRQMLLKKRESATGSDSAVFLSEKGKRIDRKNFLNREWKTALKKAGIDYRPFNNSRHSKWTNEVVHGLDIATAAHLAGNTPRTMLNRYLGVTKIPKLREWSRVTDGDD